MGFADRVKEFRKPEFKVEPERFFRPDPVDRERERNGYRETDDGETTPIEDYQVYQYDDDGEPTEPEGDKKPKNFLEMLMPQRIEEKPEISTRLFETDDIHTKSEVTRELATTLVSCIVYARQHDLPVVEEYAQFILETFVSLDRKGRTEGVEMTKAHQGVMPYMSLDESERNRGR